jgi:AcrR family transcriptional regulator
MTHSLVVPRKRPVQARSRRTVEAILTGTAQVLVARGYEGATTGAVAERAGVSIGTLYQYFPNKEALVDALVQAHVAELLGAVDVVLAESASLSLEDCALALVRAGLSAHQVNPALHKVLAEEVPRRGGSTHHLEVGRVLQQRIAAELRRRRPDQPAERTQMMAFVLETCIEALTHRAVLEAPEWLSSGALESEAAQLLGGYLQAAAC